MDESFAGNKQHLRLQLWLQLGRSEVPKQSAAHVVWVANNFEDNNSKFNVVIKQKLNKFLFNSFYYRSGEIEFAEPTP